MKYIAIIAALGVPAAFFIFLACKPAGSKLVKDIDGNSYKIVEIGSQKWFTDNLRTSRFRNGDAISNVKDNEPWEALSSAGWCDYNNDTSSGDQYKLYNWFAVNDPRGICPEGWHVPSDSEVHALIEYLGGDSLGGFKLKTKISDISNTVVTGYRMYTGKFQYYGNYCGLWTSTEGSSEFAWIFYFDCRYDDPAFYRTFFGKKNGLACRCIKD